MTGVNFIAAVHVVEKRVSIVMHGVKSRRYRDVRNQSLTADD